MDKDNLESSQEGDLRDIKSIKLNSNLDLFESSSLPSANSITGGISSVGIANFDDDILGSDVFTEAAKGTGIVVGNSYERATEEIYTWEQKNSITLDADSISLKVDQDSIYKPIYSFGEIDTQPRSNLFDVTGGISSIGITNFDDDILGSDVFTEVAKGTGIVVGNSYERATEEIYTWEQKNSITLDADSICVGLNQNGVFNSMQNLGVIDTKPWNSLSDVAGDISSLRVANFDADITVKKYEEISLDSDVFDIHPKMNQAKELFLGLIESAGSDLHYTVKQASIQSKKIYMFFTQFNFSCGNDIVFHGNDIHIGDKVYVLKEK